MTLNANAIEQLAMGCLKTDTIAGVRQTAHRDFFGLDEPGEMHYLGEAGSPIIMERRFLGWFTLTFKLPDGRHPAELAASSVLMGSDLNSLIDLINNSRYILGIISMVTPGRGLILRLEDEEFSIQSRQLSRLLNRDDGLYAHIIPDGRRGWLVGPGWMQWPMNITRSIELQLKKYQLNPIDVERILQQRSNYLESRTDIEPPHFDIQNAAVSNLHANETTG